MSQLKYLFALLFLLPAFAFGAEANTASVMTDIVSIVTNEFSSVYTSVQKAAIGFALLLFSFSLVMACWNWLLKGASGQEVLADLTKKVAYTAMCIGIINANLLMPFVSGSNNAVIADAGMIVGKSVSSDPSVMVIDVVNKGVGISNTIFRTGFSMLAPGDVKASDSCPAPQSKIADPAQKTTSDGFFATLWDKTAGAAMTGLSDLAVSIVAMLARFAGMLLLMAVAVYALWAFVQITLVIAIATWELMLIGAIGSLYLGLGGSPFTNDYFKKYLGFLFNYLMKFAVILVLYSLIDPVVNKLTSHISTVMACADYFDLYNVGNACSAAIGIGVVLYFLEQVFQRLPDSVQALLSGAPSGSSTSIATGARGDMGSMTAKGAQGVGNLSGQAGGVLKGGASTASQLASTATGAGAVATAAKAGAEVAGKGMNKF